MDSLVVFCGDFHEGAPMSVAAEPSNRDIGSGIAPRPDSPPSRRVFTLLASRGGVLILHAARDRETLARLARIRGYTDVDITEHDLDFDVPASPSVGELASTHIRRYVEMNDWERESIVRAYDTIGDIARGGPDRLRRAGVGGWTVRRIRKHLVSMGFRMDPV